MPGKTEISWSDATWNPTSGCDRVSPGCDHCYAMTLAKRLKAMGSARYQKDGDPRTSGPGFGLTLHHDALEWPLRKTRPLKIFVNSMSDLFHADVEDGFIGSVWNTMALAEQHTFQVLTKRHARMKSLLTRWQDAGWYWREAGMRWCGPLSGPLPNVWLGVSAEDQHWANLRVPGLLHTPAAVRFLSCEPLLGEIDFREQLNEGNGIDWVIVGGESGPGHRPMNVDWLAWIVQQCQDSGVPVWVKQDSGPRSGMQGRIPDDLFVQEFPA